MALKFKMMVAAGTYKDQQGAEKTKYQEIGVVMDGRDKGSFVFKLTCLPVIPNWDGFGFLAVPEQRQQRGGGHAPAARQGQNQGYARRDAAPPPADDMEDDIPF